MNFRKLYFSSRFNNRGSNRRSDCDDVWNRDPQSFRCARPSCRAWLAEWLVSVRWADRTCAAICYKLGDFAFCVIIFDLFKSNIFKKIIYFLTTTSTSWSYVPAPGVTSVDCLFVCLFVLFADVLNGTADSVNCRGSLTWPWWAPAAGVTAGVLRGGALNRDSVRAPHE